MGRSGLLGQLAAVGGYLSEIKHVLGLKEERAVLGYARVSSSTQRDDLERQKQFVVNYVKERGYGEVQMLSDIGSGLNENRKGFLKLLEMVSERKVSKVIVAYGDRFTGVRLRNVKEALLIIRNRNRGDKPRGEDVTGGACRRPDRDSFLLCREALREGATSIKRW